MRRRRPSGIVGATNEPTADLLAAFIAALRDEAEAQRQHGGHPIDVRDGHCLDVAAEGATYRFALHADVFLPDGVPVRLALDHRRLDAEVVHRQGDTILLFVEWPADADPPPETVEHATLRAEPWFLTAALADRIEALDLDQPGPARDLLDRFVGALEPKEALDPTEVDDGPQFARPTPSSQPDPTPHPDRPNPWQEAAIDACRRDALHFVWGPPGTGKTRTLGELVARLARDGATVLVVAHANVAVDAAALATAHALGLDRPEVLRGPELPPTVVRAGPPAIDAVRGLGIASGDVALRRRPDLARRLRTLTTELGRLQAAGTEPGRSAELRRQLREVRAELRDEERAAVASAQVLLATLPKATVDAVVHGRRFDAVVVDEASMAVPPQVLFAASLARRHLAVFGDFRQLAPIVTSTAIETRRWLGRDAFELAGIPAAVDRGAIPAGLSMLRVQYRMHPSIRRLVGDFAYLGRLEDGPSVVETAAIAERPPAPGEPIVLLETERIGARTWLDARRTSRWSPMSAVWAVRFAHELAHSGLDVALLAPYRPQTALLNALVGATNLRETVTTGTIHRFQGAERSAVVLDLADGPPLRPPGTLLRGPAGLRLLTVATSRARGKVVVLASRALLEAPGPAAALLADLAPLPLPTDQWTLVAGNTTLEWFADVERATDALARDAAGAIAAWLPEDLPRALRGLVRRPDVDQTRRGAAIVLADEVVWILGVTPTRSWAAARVVSRGVVRAVWLNLTGSRLPAR